ncbi:hypothetical protein MNBD_ALPHA09-243 [hydrothermal vent metagenome]|uniref:L,D-TPase catalytic domain-containing protein n=1 Tax=hydrothermal vent metagenome TaxID=652676 RepID=A0A3B0U6X3_9ZZZZ
MLNRRSFILTAAATTLLPIPALAHKRPFKIAAKYLPQTVAFSGYEPNTIVVDAAARFLYWVEAPGRARRYGVGVGRAALAWRGKAIIGRKAKWPRWTPTKNMIRREPNKYARFRNGVPGGASNPLGARALYLYRNGRDTMYRIHGTNQPNTIGLAVSNGCIRLLNAHVKDLYSRVPVGVEVVVL